LGKEVEVTRKLEGACHLRDVCCGFVSEVLALIERTADEKGFQRSLRLQGKSIESHHVVLTCKKYQPAVARLCQAAASFDSIDQIQVIEGYRGVAQFICGCPGRGDLWYSATCRGRLTANHCDVRCMLQLIDTCNSVPWRLIWIANRGDNLVHCDVDSRHYFCFRATLIRAAGKGEIRCSPDRKTCTRCTPIVSPN
jgi:hypothetical protein